MLKILFQRFRCVTCLLCHTKDEAATDHDNINICAGSMSFLITLLIYKKKTKDTTTMALPQHPATFGIQILIVTRQLSTFELQLSRHSQPRFEAKQ